MSRKTEYIYNSGVNSGLQEETNTSNLWTEVTYNNFGVYTPVFYANNLYINFTGTFVLPASTTPITTPATDTTNWRIIGSGSHVRDITVTEDSNTGIVSIVITATDNTTSTVTFNSGHTIVDNGGTSLAQRIKLQSKGTNAGFKAKDTDTTELDLSQVDTNKTNADASKAVTDKITLGTSSAISIANNGSISLDGSTVNLSTINAKVAHIDVDVDINLDTIAAQMAAIIKALGRSNEGFTSQVLSLPDATRSWTTPNFTTSDVLISSSGVVSKVSNTAWAYGVGGELYVPPTLAYHKQTATVNGNSFLYITIGVSLSKIYHAGYIDVLEDIKEYASKTDAEKALLPNPNNIFFENYQGHQFSATVNHSDESTNGLTVFEYTPSDNRQRLFTITLPILASVDSHYDSQDKFEIQTDKGLNAFFYHSGTDSVITAGLKAAIAANAAAIGVLDAQAIRYPDITAINTATTDQILVKKNVNTSGTKAVAVFEVVSVNSSGAETMRIVTPYAEHSPLTSFNPFLVPFTTVSGDNTATAAAFVTGFESGTDSNLVLFRDGYTGTDGIAYGGYVATSSGAIVTMTSDNVGAVYNTTSLGIYETVGRLGVDNARAFEHGTGGPEARLEFIDLPASTPITIADTAALATFRGSGYVAGAQFITTAADIEAPIPDVAAQVTITYPATSTDVDYKVITGMISETDTDFFEQDLAASPSNFPTRFFVGAFNAQAATITDMNATELRIRVLTTDTAGSARATAAAAAINTFNGSTRLTAVAPVTQGAAYSLNCTAVADGANLIITSNTAGARTTLVDAETGGSTSMVIRQGATSSPATLGGNSLYQVISPTQLMNLTAGTVVTVL